MNHDKINEIILEVYRTCSIRTFPIDCISILQKYGYCCIPYDRLSTKKQQACEQISHDSFLLNHTIYYNAAVTYGRIRFSLMHELGHILLGHHDSSPEDEADANTLASNLLAPRMAIHYTHSTTDTQIASHFKVTLKAARYMYQDYLRWYKHITQCGMSPLDKEVYQHFYNKKCDCFGFFCTLEQSHVSKNPALCTKKIEPTIDFDRPLA